MYKLGLFLLLLAYSNAKLTDIDVGTEAKISVPRKKVCLSNASKEILWVLDLNDDELNFKQLRSANKMDRRVFREVMEPSIKQFEYRQLSAADTSATTRKQSANEVVDSELITRYDVKKLILWMFNKFLMPYQGEPSLHAHLGDNNKVSIKLYFKGPYTSLVVRYKNKRWNYFLDPPSSLPRWFYEKHSNTTRSGQSMFVEIPDSIRNEFYGKFFNLLEAFMSYAL